MSKAMNTMKRVSVSLVAVGVLSMSGVGAAGASATASPAKSTSHGATAGQLKHFNCATAQRRLGFQGRLLASTDATIARMTKAQNAATAAAAAATATPSVAARETAMAAFWGKQIAKQQKRETRLKNSAKLTAAKTRMANLYAQKCVASTPTTTTTSSVA